MRLALFWTTLFLLALVVETRRRSLFETIMSLHSKEIGKSGGGERSSPEITPLPVNKSLDLEKQDRETESNHSLESQLVTSRRESRTQSLTRRNTSRGQFTHPLSHVKTSDAEIVDFDGLDDPYRPQNWPFRKKMVTTLLYGKTWGEDVLKFCLTNMLIHESC